MNQSSTLKAVTGSVLLGLLLSSSSAWAWMNKQEVARFDALENRVGDLQRRLERAERLLESSNLQKMFLRLERSEEYSRRLQGQIEELEYKLNQMDKHQRQLYLDFDQRLQDLQSAPRSGYQSPTDLGDEAADSGELPQLDEQAQYKAAFDQLKAASYQDAISGFKAFLQAWPASSLAGNAQYWLGEAYYGAGEFQNAATEFEKVRSLYPESRKVPDASLKLAYSYYAQKKWGKARKILQEIKAHYPDSAVAGLAEDRLKRMKLEGH
jgi:tol-pal system protein YbgF